jgi:hypothetical protein
MTKAVYPPEPWLIKQTLMMLAAIEWRAKEGVHPNPAVVKAHFHAIENMAAAAIAKIEEHSPWTLAEAETENGLFIPSCVASAP